MANILLKNLPKKFIHIFLMIFVFAQNSFLCAFAPTNFYQSSDSNVYLPNILKKNLTVGMNIEAGSRGGGRSWDGKSCDVLQLHDEKQKVIEMKRSRISDELHQKIKATTLAGGFGSNEKQRRGHVVFNGDFAELDDTFFAAYKIPFKIIPGKLFISGWFPVKRRQIKNVRWNDLTNTENITVGAGIVIKRFNTNTSTFIQNLQTNVKYLADIDLSPTTSSGLGDLTLLLNWRKGFRKQEEMFSNIYAFAKAGIDLPTGKKKNIDKIFSMALGNDGHWGIPFGVGGECLVIKQVKLGIHLDFLYSFSKTRLRRLKTAEGQTEFLLLNKGVAEMDPGFQWQVNQFVQAFRVYKGLSGKLAYQYIRHNRDKLKLKDENFETRLRAYNVSDSNARINSINSLKRWSIHNAIFQINWDVAEAVKDIWGAPQVSLFYKQPFSGRNLINTNTFGGQLAVNF
jgi:hypothetical protein